MLILYSLPFSNYSAKVTAWRKHVDVHPAVTPVLDVSEATTREWLAAVTNDG